MKQLLPLAFLLICSAYFTHAQSTLDSTFAQTGIIQFDFGANAESIAFGVVTSPNMTSYTAIAKEQNGSQSIIVRSHTASGSVNTSFGQNGNIELFLPPGSQIENLFMHYTANNQVIGLVTIYNDLINAYGYMMTKINASGAQIPSFGTNGVVEQLIPNLWIEVVGMEVDAQQNIYIYGARENDDMQSPVFDYPFIAKHQANGQLDANFANNGIFDFGIEFDGVIGDVAFNDNGDLIALGMNYDLEMEAFLAAINTSGNLVTSFGSLGFANISAAGDNLEPVGVYITSEDHVNVIMQGMEFPSLLSVLAVKQFNANGLPNLTFGNSGVSSSVQLGPELQFVFASSGLPDNGAVVSSIIFDMDEELTYSRIIKLNSEGSLDANFGTNGFFEFDLGGSSHAVVDLHVASEEKLYTSGAILDLSTETTAAFISRLNLKPEVTNISILSDDKPFEILAFPNPASDFINVSIGNTDLTETTLHLIDLSGRKVFHTIADFSFDNTHTLQIPEALPAGLYYIGFKSAEGRPVYKSVQVIR